MRVLASPIAHRSFDLRTAPKTPGRRPRTYTRLGSAALAAPVGALKQFKVPTANSQPRAITNGSDGNRWFTEGTEFTAAPAKIARITPAGDITEFAPDVADGCNFCIITDIAQGPGGILYITSNDPTLMRFNVATQSFETPVQMPNTNALGGNLAVSATDVWITDFNNDVVWRYHLSNGQFTSFPVSDPADVAVDAAGNAWFTQPGDVNAPGTSNIGRIDAATGAVTTTPTTDGSTTVAPREHHRRLRWAGLVHRPVHAPGCRAPQPVQQLGDAVPRDATPGLRASPPHPTAPCGSPRRPKAMPPGSPTPASSPRARRSRAAAHSGSPSPPTATPGTR